MPDVLALARAQRAALARQDQAVMSRLISAFTALYGRLSDKIELLARDLADAENLTAGKLARMDRYRALLAAVQDELTRYGTYAHVEMATAADAAIAAAQRDARALVTAVSPSVAGQFGALHTDAVRVLLSFLDPQGPLFARLEALAPYGAQQVADTIVEKIAAGYNPAQWAGAIRDQLGVPLTDALRMARTVQLYSYRESSRASYVANSDVVSGWIWFAELDSDTCLSCVAQHGTVHSNDETLDDHYNGRCAMVPNVIGVENPVTQGGQAWFDSLPEEQQRAMMGTGRHEAWKAGKFDFAALSRQQPDLVYGHMRSETPLKDLVGA